MYDDKNLIYIFTMLECSEKIWIYTDEYSNAIDFISANEQKDLNAVNSMFIAIGEESKKINETLKQEINTKINWQHIAGIRDKISHDYRGIDEDILWFIIHNDLHKLKEALVEMVELISPLDDVLCEFLKSDYYRHLQYLKK